MENEKVKTKLNYNSNNSIKLFNIVKKNFNWKKIKNWQKNKNTIFPINANLKKNNLFNNNTKTINYLIKYPIEFDLNNKDIEMDNDYIYKKRIDIIQEQIKSFKPIMNPLLPIFKVFDQPLFTNFVDKSVPDNAIDPLKKPAGIFKESLIPKYDNFVDKNTIVSDYLLIYNEKSVFISDSKYSSSMSYPHLICIPNKHIYNCVTLDIDDIPLLENMMYGTQKYFNENFTKCLAEFGARCIDYIFKNPDKYDNNFALLEKNNVVDILIKLLDKTYEIVKNKNINDIKYIYNILLNMLNNSDITNYDKKLNFYFHIHPYHGIGHLHMQCLFLPLKTESWNHFIYQFINVNDVIDILKNKK